MMKTGKSHQVRLYCNNCKQCTQIEIPFRVRVRDSGHLSQLRLHSCPKCGYVMDIMKD